MLFDLLFSTTCASANFVPLLSFHNFTFHNFPFVIKQQTREHSHVMLKGKKNSALFICEVFAQ